MFLTSPAVFNLKPIIPLFDILGHTLITQAAKEEVEGIPPSGEAIITRDVFFLVGIGFLGWLGHWKGEVIELFLLFFCKRRGIMSAEWSLPFPRSAGCIMQL